MKLLAATVITLSLLASASAQDSQPIRITRSGSQPSRQGPAENYTGSARIDTPFQGSAPALDGKAVEWMEKVSDEQQLVLSEATYDGSGGERAQAVRVQFPEERRAAEGGDFVNSSDVALRYCLA